MSLADTLIILSILCQPTPYTGYSWQVEKELATRDAANEALAVAEYDTPEWWEAQTTLAGAEARLADLFDMKPKPLPVLDYDDGLFDLGLTAA